MAHWIMSSESASLSRRPAQRALLTLLVLMTSIGFVGAVSAEGATRLYKWTDDQGKVHYSERLLQESAGKASVELNRQGTVVKRNARALTAEEYAAREKAEREKEEADQHAREEQRKNLALLSSYASAMDIEQARTRALQSNRESTLNVTHNLNVATKQRDKLQQQIDALQGRPMSPRLKRDWDANQADLKVQQQLLSVKQREATSINARYDDEKQRYQELTLGKSASATQ